MYNELSKYILARVPACQADIQTILSRFKPMKVLKNEILLGESDTSKRMHFVIHGCLRIYYLQADGSEATRYLAFENNFATGLMAFISQKPSEEYIQALENTELLYITRNDFYDLVDLLPAWEKFFRNYLEHAYVNNTRKLMSFITMDATQRFQYLMAENPQVVQRLSNKIVANYLGISQEALSRIKGKLSKL
jgi:CRP-like cAMP-binding protein